MGGLPDAIADHEHRRDLTSGSGTVRARHFRSILHRPGGRFFPARDGAGGPRGRSRSSSDPTVIPLHGRDSLSPGASLCGGGWEVLAVVITRHRAPPRPPPVPHERARPLRPLPSPPTLRLSGGLSKAGARERVHTHGIDPPQR